MIRLFRHYFDIPAIVLATCEMGVLYWLVYGIGIALGSDGLAATHESWTVAARLVTLTTVTGMVSVGLYSRDHFFRKEDVLSRAVVVLPLLIVFMGAMLYISELVMSEDHEQKYYILCAGALTAFFPVLIATRSGFVQIIDRTDAFKRRVLVLGSGKRAAKIEALCRHHLDRSFTLVGYVRFGAGPTKSSNDVIDHRRGAQRRTDYWVDSKELAQFCHDQKVEELVVATAERRGLPIQDLLACKLQGIKITEYPDFWERESGQIDLEEISPSWLVYSDGFQMGVGRMMVKRLFDILLSALLLLLTLPLTLSTALLIKLESRGPIFYRQERVGLRGKPFMVLKFRSMSVDAEKDGPRWAAKNDARVTRVGAFIRKVRIDEIPQVINVLKGDMAFVGPRPERPIFVSALTEKIPYYNERHVVKPGITGWAQINYPYGATEEDAKMKLAYDLYYIKNGSLFLDILTIMQTVKVLMWNSGAR